MNKKSILILCATLLFTACASKQQITKEPSVDAQLKLLVDDGMKYTDLDKQDEDELIRGLLKNSPGRVLLFQNQRRHFKFYDCKIKKLLSFSFYKIS
ncbi:Uncharacterised protein [Campylobacter jejuni subsp. doylei]|nr:Uncharacterised protein [Campylobacter jejuni subsp. doylei]